MKNNKFDLAVIGSGSGGLSIAAGAAMLGLNVALFEKGKMGGDCLNYGCIPSKSLLAAAKTRHHIIEASDYGIKAHVDDVNLSKVMDHVSQVIANIAPHDSVERFTQLGVSVIQHQAKFYDKQAIIADGQLYTARRIVIASGSSPSIPPIPGLENIPYYTNESIFNLKQTPFHLIVIGGGPIGCELAQAFLFLGVKVTVLEAFNIFPHDEIDLANIMRQTLQNQGLVLHENTTVKKIYEENDLISVEIECDEKSKLISGSHLLLATGRHANVKELNLEKAGISYTAKGIQVDNRLRTSNKKIYAIGDVIGSYQFTHIANYHAGIALRNILFRLPVKVDYRSIPWVTYTEPELAHAGLLEKEALKQYPKAKILEFEFAEIDRAQADKQTKGKIKIIATKRGRVLGVSILGTHAGELLLPWIMIIRENRSLRSLTDAIVPYPTLSEISKRVASEFYAPKLFSPLVKLIVRFLQLFP